MKAAVMYDGSGLPEYSDFPEPAVKNEDEVLVSVKAVAIKHFDKGRASGKHYSAAEKQQDAKVIGGDGICLLADGTRVYGMGVSGMLAERAVIDKDRIVLIPDGLDDATAAALPNAVIGAAMALKFRANIQPGDTVLINGATGFTGRAAVQIAKHYGAKTVIATGRNQQSLRELLSLGADKIISLQQEDAEFVDGVKAIHQSTPINVIVDYLWRKYALCIRGQHDRRPDPAIGRQPQERKFAVVRLRPGKLDQSPGCRIIRRYIAGDVSARSFGTVENRNG
jgi:NADPH:quinone reductase-like Zn-dependent oxidoreductase